MYLVVYKNHVLNLSRIQSAVYSPPTRTKKSELLIDTSGGEYGYDTTFEGEIADAFWEAICNVAVSLEE